MASKSKIPFEIKNYIDLKIKEVTEALHARDCKMIANMQIDKLRFEREIKDEVFRNVLELLTFKKIKRGLNVSESELIWKHNTGFERTDISVSPKRKQVRHKTKTA